MEVKKVVVASVFFILMFALSVIFGPLRNTSRDTLQTFGTIEEVVETRSKDVAIKLKDDNKLYYIQHSLRKRSLPDLKKELAGRSVNVYYVKRWTPVDPLRVHHITKVDLNNTTLYSQN